MFERLAHISNARFGVIASGALLGVLFASPVEGQEHIWSQRFGDAENQRTLDAAIDSSGNVFVTGYFRGTVDFGGGPLESKYRRAGYLASFDPSGNHLWSRRFPNVRGLSVIADVVGDVLLTGYFGGSVDFGGGRLRGEGMDDIFLVKFDPGGTHLWSLCFGDDEGQSANCVAVDASGNVLLTGNFSGTVDFGGGPLCAGHGSNIFLAKFDPNGGYVWSRRFGYDDWHDYYRYWRSAESVVADRTGNVYLTGYFERMLDVGGGALVSAGRYDIFLAKFDSQGTHLWSRRFGDGDSQRAKSVAVDALGNVFLTGLFYGRVDFGGGALKSAGSYDIFLAKFDPEGRHLWGQRYGDELGQRGSSVAVDASGAPVIAGSFEGVVDFGGGPLVSAGHTDVYVVGFDPSGTHLWSQRFGDEADDQYASAVQIDASGNLFLAGEFEGAVDFGGESLVSEGGFEIFLAKFEPFSPIVRTVAFDIKPTSCPNPLNIKPFQESSRHGNKKKGGVLPVAIVGTDGFDVSDINPSTLFLVGAPPLRHEYKDVTAAVVDGEECECTEVGPDGYMDLTLKFSKADIVEALGAVSHDDVIPLTITGRLYDGTEIVGTDCVWIRHDIQEPPPPQPLFIADEKTMLGPAVPNPFNPRTQIGFRVDKDGPVSLRIYDISGRVIKTLVNDDKPAGVYTEEWDGRDDLGNHVASGVYFYRLTAGNKTLTRKAVLVR